MKLASKLFCCMILSFCMKAAIAQEQKIAVDVTKPGSVVLIDFPGALPVEGYSGNEVIITSSSDKFKAPDRAKGLKPIYAGGTDNTGMGVSMEKKGNDLVLQCLLPFSGTATYKIRVPENFSVKIKSGCERNSNVTVSNMKNEVEVNVCHAITVKNSTGPLVLSNISGEIDVDFSEISKDKPISIATISGEIDVHMPARTAMDLHMNTLSGAMYSDFDFSNEDKQLKRIGGSAVQAKLNGGGVDLKLTSVSGNIYLRKK